MAGMHEMAELICEQWLVCLHHNFNSSRITMVDRRIQYGRDMIAL